MTWNGAHLLPPCLDALLAQGAQVLVVDNASVDGTADLLADRYPSVTVLVTATNEGFAGGVARALEVVATPVVALVNNDAVVRSDWLARLLPPLAATGVAAVAGKLVLPDGRLNSAGGAMRPDGYGYDVGFGQPDDGRFDQPGEIFYATGAAVAYRIDAVRAVGGVDPRYFMYYEDVSLSWRLRLAGWSVRYVPDAVVEHEHSATTGAGSLRHTRWTERNRLATLALCAPAGLAARAVVRFPLTTVSVALFESRPKAVQRVLAYGEFLRWLPSLVRSRRRVVTTVSRRDVERRFLRSPGAPARSRGGRS